MKCPICGGTTFLKSPSVKLRFEQDGEALVCEHCGYILAFNEKVVKEQTRRKENLEQLKIDLRKVCEFEKSYKAKVPSIEKEKLEVEGCRKKLVLLIKHNPEDEEIKKLESRIEKLREIIDRKNSSLVVIRYREILRKIEFLKEQIKQAELQIKENQY